MPTEEKSRGKLELVEREREGKKRRFVMLWRSFGCVSSLQRSQKSLVLLSGGPFSGRSLRLKKERKNG